MSLIEFASRGVMRWGAHRLRSMASSSECRRPVHADVSEPRRARTWNAAAACTAAARRRLHSGWTMLHCNGRNVAQQATIASLIQFVPAVSAPRRAAVMVSKGRCRFVALCIWNCCCRCNSFSPLTGRSRWLASANLPIPPLTPLPHIDLTQRPAPAFNHADTPGIINLTIVASSSWFSSYGYFPIS